MSFDQLQDLIRKKKNPTVVGLDPDLAHIPPQIMEAQIRLHGETLEAAAQAVWVFNQAIIDAIWDIVPAVKPQSAYYEALGVPGMEALARTMAYAREKGLFVIGDMKRGDIGSTAAAYSKAYLGTVTVGSASLSPFPCDAVTVNGYLGSDGLLPFLEDCKAHDKCAFALVKTSNPSSGELQDLVAGDRLVYQVVGDLIARLSRGTEGKYGYGALGAVVGATYPSDLKALRRRLENTFFLIPGYGAQGGTAEDVRYAFNKYGHGAIVNSSRGITCAWQKAGLDGAADYANAAREAAIQMRDDLRQFIPIA